MVYSKNERKQLKNIFMHIQDSYSNAEAPSSVKDEQNTVELMSIVYCGAVMADTSSEQDERLYTWLLHFIDRLYEARQSQNGINESGRMMINACNVVLNAQRKRNNKRDNQTPEEAEGQNGSNANQVRN